MDKKFFIFAPVLIASLSQFQLIANDENPGCCSCLRSLVNLFRESDQTNGHQMTEMDTFYGDRQPLLEQQYSYLSGRHFPATSIQNLTDEDESLHQATMTQPLGADSDLTNSMISDVPAQSPTPDLLPDFGHELSDQTSDSESESDHSVDSLSLSDPVPNSSKSTRPAIQSSTSSSSSSTLPLNAIQGLQTVAQLSSSTMSLEEEEAQQSEVTQTFSTPTEGSERFNTPASEQNSISESEEAIGMTEESPSTPAQSLTNQNSQTDAESENAEESQLQLEISVAQHHISGENEEDEVQAFTSSSSSSSSSSDESQLQTTHGQSAFTAPTRTVQDAPRTFVSLTYAKWLRERFEKLTLKLPKDKVLTDFKRGSKEFYNLDEREKLRGTIISITERSSAEADSLLNSIIEIEYALEKENSFFGNKQKRSELTATLNAKWAEIFPILREQN